LALEVVWSRLLTQVFGASSLAVATVLATFMGGLALGSWLGGKFADRHRQRGLFAYALCELGIAVSALLVPLALGAYPAINAWLWQHLADSPTALAGLRFVFCGLLLIVPTTLMGATLPILTRHVVQRPRDLGLLGQRVSALYAANTLGAVLGAALTGFYLLPTIGQARATHAAVAADLTLTLGLLATLWWRGRRPPGEDLLANVEVELAPGQAAAPEPPPPLSPALRRALLLTVFCTGALAMILEVLWSRALAMVIGSSVYSVTLVLVVFLAGLAAGAAWIGRPAARSRRPLLGLGVAIVMVGLTVVLTHRVLDDLPRLFLELLEGNSLAVGAIMALQGICAAVAVLPTALAMGAVLPLGLRAYAGDASRVGRDVGRAYAANTLGAIAGSLAGGFLILPVVGLEHGVRLVGALLLGLGIILVAFAGGPGRPRLRTAFASLAAVGLGALMIAPRWDASALTAGVFRMSVARRDVQRGAIQSGDLVYYRDGVSTTVTVERYHDRLALKNNGKVEASSFGDMPTQVLVGLLPVLMHGGHDLKVAVVGYGSGITVGAIAASPQVARVDVIELEPAVLEAADTFFDDFNNHAARDPKVHRHLGDGRNFLTAQPGRYDIIVSEPSNPWIAGVASLFTREFYGFAKAHLAADGVFCQWAQLYELGPSSVKTIYATFLEAFPEVIAWTPGDLSSDTILVGANHPLTVDDERLGRLATLPGTRQMLARAGVDRPAELVAQILLAPDEVSSFAAGGVINTDDNGRLEFYAPRDLLASARGPRLADAIFSWQWPYAHLDELVTGLGSGAARGAREADIARALLGKGRRREAARWMARAQADGQDIGDLERLARAVALRDGREPEVALDAGGGGPAPAIGWFDPELPLATRQEGVRTATTLAAAARAADYDGVVRAARKLPAAAPGTAGDEARLYRGFAAYHALEFDEARRFLRRLCDDDDDDDLCHRRPAALYYYGRVLYGIGEFEKGAALLDELCRRWPELVPGAPSPP
jgi:spermidine synthase